MDLWARLALAALLMVAAGYGAYANKSRSRADGESLLAFLIERDNFNDWGRVWRLVALVSFLAVVGVATMKMVATLLGGPLIDLDQFR